MNQTPAPKNRQITTDLAHQLDELQGFLDLGMQQDTLRLARRLLRLRPVHPLAFSEALSAVLIQSDNLRRWRDRVEAAHAALPKAQHSAVRHNMLGFYVSIRDWEKAARFILGRPRMVPDLMFTMWTLLELDRLADAKPIQRKCIKILQTTSDRFEASMLLDALAAYHARIGQWNKAEQFWAASPPEQPLFDTAAPRLVQLQAIRGRWAVVAGQAGLEQADSASDETDLMLPGNRAGRAEDTRKELARYDRALQKIVPESELRSFGMGENRR